MIRAIVALIFLTACGGGGKSTEPAQPTPAAEPTPAGDLAWADMDHEQRAQFMKDTVLPKMKELFTGYNPEEFAEMNCARNYKTPYPAGSVSVLGTLPSG